MSDEAQVRQAISSALGDVPADVKIFASGAVSVTVGAPGGDIVSIDGTADGAQWGVSRLSNDANPFIGHDRAAASLADALAIARELLAPKAG